MNAKKLKEYIKNIQDGERVVETNSSIMQGMKGTVYTNKDNVKCIAWDEFDSGGAMKTSFTHGARRLSDVEENDNGRLTFLVFVLMILMALMGVFGMVADIAVIIAVIPLFLWEVSLILKNDTNKDL